MKLRNLLGWPSALCLSACVLTAQEATQLDQLKTQLQKMQESFEKQQREIKENFEKLVREQQAQIDVLKKQLEASKTGVPPAVAKQPAPGAARPGEVTPEQLKELNEKLDQ